MSNSLRTNTNRWRVAGVVSVLLCVVGSLLSCGNVARESAQELAETPVAAAPTGKAVPRSTQTSTNPLFADGVPEHLQCPEEWIGTYLSDLPPEAATQMQKIAAEVIDRYNPNRPLADVWDPYIEAEKAYQHDADPQKKNLAIGADRYDWYIQIILDFPEIVILTLEDGSRSNEMRLIDMGIRNPKMRRRDLKINPYTSGLYRLGDKPREIDLGEYE